MIHKIEDTHKKNFELIKKYNLKVGDKIKLKKGFKYFSVDHPAFTISHIHGRYGWISFKETEQLPQEVEELIKIIELKGGDNNNDN